MSGLQQVLRNERISDYLEARGVEVQSTGSRKRCVCPLPGHDEQDPSFYIGQFPDGAEYFKCFGCQASGSLLGLVSALEGKPVKQVVRELLGKHGLDQGEARTPPPEPLPHEIDAAFCEEDLLAADIATFARTYMRSRGGCEDAVNKVSRLYKRLDEMTAAGDVRGMAEVLKGIKRLLAKEGRKKAEREATE